MNEFFDVTLGEVVDFFNGKAIKPGQDGEYPAYGSNGLIGGAPDWKYENSIIIGRVGAYCGSVAYCKSRFWASDNTIVARPKSGDVGYFYYLLKALELNRYAGGAAQPLVTQTVLKGVPARVPDIPTQRRIASILSAYDDLIENNTRRIAILEEMARRIYEEWFVRFRFPGHEQVKMVESELGLIPEGWKATNIGEVAENHDRKRKPLSKMQREKFKGPYPYYGAAKIFDYVEDYIFDGRFVLMAEDGSVITPDGFPVLQLANGRFWANNHTHILRGTPDASTEFIYLRLSSQKVSGYITGAAQPKITQANMNRIPVCLPPRDLMARFTELVGPKFDLIDCLERKHTNLRATRDLLLPKLISGELDVSTLPEPEEAIAA
ncbi:restriction endonuclease subunit S [Thauera aminoaromatica]|uniref:Restriction modification system DNA specificity domain protein n=1 Tax=Thauera aminoaromatica TaxID=164330 RepID=C4ZIB4_THASP|nr:restriction endonuclease subunit S [Thauera aminoaromatica]ACK52808.1 restriction modification system DNA specificity domain protein [Thauera aminoaromatica]